MGTSNYWLNIKGCLEKYRDLDATSVWVAKAKLDMGEAEFRPLVDQIHEWLMQHPSFRDISGELYQLLEKFDPERDLQRRKEHKDAITTYDQENQSRLIELVSNYLKAHNFEAADKVYGEQCFGWWGRADYNSAVARAKEEAARQAAEEEARKIAEQRESLRNQMHALLIGRDYSEADRLYCEQCSNWWSRTDYAADVARAKAEEAREAAEETARRIAKEREYLRNQVQALLAAFDYGEADQLYRERCTDWWSRANYDGAVAHAKEEEAGRAAVEEARKIAAQREKIRSEIIELLDIAKYGEADLRYRESCVDWWTQIAYEAEKKSAQFMHKFVQTYRDGSLAELDNLFNHRDKGVPLSTDDYVALKQPKVRDWLAALGLRLDAEQEQANARPESRLLIKARAGSGKTRTLCARAALAICDEKLEPNQVLVVAFNKAAAAEIKHRIQILSSITGYENARTFHSLAYQLVKPKKKLLFDVGGHPSTREQSRFVQRMMQRILNPAFKDAMVEFFRKELEQIEAIGRDLQPDEYYVVRRSLEQVTLKGERVKSNGEKFIADFLFEHGIEYRYERVWHWKSEFLDGSIYRPDFSIVANGADYILEHWALNPGDPVAQLPDYWGISASDYRQQITDKRVFWQSTETPLLETHAGMLRDGREAFESQLKRLLEDNGIRCERLTSEDIVGRVFENDFTISRIAVLFLQFIQRAKRRGWSADVAARRISENLDHEARSRLFHELALRAYREYESMLAEQGAMDFDDLLVQATKEVGSRGASASIHLGKGETISLDRLKWILIDEYQDFSELYFQMLEAILEVNPNVRLVAVGDDWQAINAFAGAETRFFQNFSNYFSGAESVGVTTNYRSDQAVVEAGNRLMIGRGSPAKVSRSATGLIERRYIGDVFIEFRQGKQFQLQRDNHKKYLPPQNNEGNPSERALKHARSLRICSEIILQVPEKKVMLIARTNRVYGVELKDFRNRLIKILSSSGEIDRETWERSVFAMTAHGSKGQEAHTVIILDATQGQFPKIHPDNLLFELFGVTPRSVLEEERRLFYVAITRAEQQLFVLSEKGFESPYLKELDNKGSVMHAGIDQGLGQKLRPLSDLAIKIKKQTAELRVSPEILRKEMIKPLKPWEFVRANVSPSFLELIAALEKSEIPIPEVEYYLAGEEEDEELRAELAWPAASLPIAILASDQVERTGEWVSRGWKVPGADLPIDKILIGLRHYLLGKKQ